ncbi:hypothetical protein CSB45_13215 [candidate division KSB3 bacterium]|uniref:Uncharacterized protein n=1 Tax=candidate division KSB3 bacterium TaxID=2044937 RepID=A0A2G6E1S0_9BACT|nr:MAG: hypothetical protein CSB45_13215 [candidate division KSB3 bacterium]PIE28657.1 MAG: hypothetical protein CSA57_12870 [candidate division KSB3 bacterium]
MTLEEFIASAQFPDQLSEELRALWEDAGDNWDAAHQIVQSLNSRDAMWIHAYLHRKEGDLSNSHYWYSRARRAMPDIPLDTEWQMISSELLDRKS